MHENIEETNVKVRVCMAIVAALLCALPVCAEEASDSKESVALESEMDKVSYALGAQMGQSFKKQNIEISLDVFLRAIKDGLAGVELAMTEEEMRQVMMEFQKRMMAERQAQMKVEGEKNLKESNAFLEENKKKEGVTVLPSGLQYKVLEEGTGRTPTETDQVKTHYRGTFLNGEEFDSSYKRGQPAQFPVKGGIIPGWTEALLLMKEGAKWQLFIPPNLAYGERGRGPTIPPNAALIFEIELIEVVTPANAAE